MAQDNVGARDKPVMTKDTRAESFYGLGVNYWQCSYDQTTRYQDKALFNTDQFHYRKMDYSPEALADRQKAQACVTKAFEYFEKALEIDPEYTRPCFIRSALPRTPETDQGRSKTQRV